MKLGGLESELESGQEAPTIQRSTLRKTHTPSHRGSTYRMWIEMEGGLAVAFDAGPVRVWIREK